MNLGDLISIVITAKQWVLFLVTAKPISTIRRSKKEGGLLPATSQESTVVVPQAMSAFRAKEACDFIQEACTYLHTKPLGVDTVLSLLYLKSILFTK